MSLHASLRKSEDGSSSFKVGMGYEDGRVELWALAGAAEWDKPSDGRTGVSPWQRRYEGKKHNEAGKLGSSMSWKSSFTLYPTVPLKT